jgi:2-haloacid dehalogenase
MMRLQNEVVALVFDTWGTVVDWHSSVLADLIAFGSRKNMDIDWEIFLGEWRSAYGPAMQKINSGATRWMKSDEFYRDALVRLFAKYKVTGLAEEEIQFLNCAWTRTRPWADSVPGLKLLKSRYILSPLSNASFAWLVAIARYGDLPFDCIISSENAKRYKPDPAVYRTALDLLGCKPQQVMLVAAHNYDLHAARSLGLRTAFIPRPTEHSPHQAQDLQAEENWDVIAKDMVDLARKMECDQARI